MHGLWQPEPIYKGRRVYIIGGGQTLTWESQRLALQLERDRSARIIAVNNAYMLFPFCSMLYAGDLDWFDDNASDIDARFFGDYIVGRAAVQEHWPFRKLYKRVARDMASGLSRSPGVVAGWCSGSNAVNVAYWLGAEEIILIAFDMKGNNWHTLHKRPKKEGCYETFITYFDKMAAELAKTNCKVINCSPDTELKCFPIRPLVETIGARLGC